MRRAMWLVPVVIIMIGVLLVLVAVLVALPLMNAERSMRTTGAATPPAIPATQDSATREPIEHTATPTRASTPTNEAALTAAPSPSPARTQTPAPAPTRMPPSVVPVSPTSTASPPSAQPTLPAAAPTSQGTVPSGADFQVMALSSEMARVINRARCDSGLTPLVTNDVLGNTALVHSIDMAVNDFFDHVGSDGSQVSGRASAQGYPWIAIGENLAAGSRSVEQTFNLWWNSPGHQANMLDPDFVEMGLGVVVREASEYDWYWTLVLGSRGTTPPTCAELGY